MRFLKHILVHTISLFIACVVVISWLHTNERPDLGVQGSDLCAYGTVPIGKRVQHDFALVNRHSFPVQVDTTSEQCCATIQAFSSTRVIAPHGTATVHVAIDTHGRGAGEHCESACIVTRHNGQQSKVWLSLQYTVAAPFVASRGTAP